MGGEPQLERSSTEVSVASKLSLAMSWSPIPENMGFMGVWSASKLYGLPTVLPEVDRGGVAGKYESMSVSRSMAGFCALTGPGEPVGVRTDGPLL